MADVSKIKLDNTTYDVKDSIARNNMIYSSNEIAVGTWIDNKTIYRKVIVTTTPSDTTPTYIGNITNLDKMINMYGFLTYTNGFTQQIPLAFSYGNTIYSSIYTEINNIVCKLNDSVYQSKDCFIVCEYTKTTD